MDVLLERVPVEKHDVLFRLLQYSLFEESLTDGSEIRDDALFDYPWFEAYFLEPQSKAYFIKDAKRGCLLGFAMVREENGVCSVAEFMVLPKYRRRGIGTKSARLCFDSYKGRWTVRPSYGSEPARLFWRQAIEAYTGRSPEWANGRFEFET